MCREACYVVVGLQTRVKYDPCPWVCPYRLRRETVVKTGGFAMEQEAKMETGRGSHEGTGRLPSPGAGAAG